MRYGQILQQLSEHGSTPVSRTELTRVLKITDRTLSSDVRLLNRDGEKHGFTIQTIRGRGYSLRVEDRDRFTHYYQELQSTAEICTDVNQRLNLIEMHLLLAGDFITSEQLAQRLGVSVPTIKSDIKQTQPFFTQHHLAVIGRAHYGSYVEGSEACKRRAIIDLFRARLPEPVLTPEYQSFIQSLNEAELRHQLVASLQRHQLSMNDALLKNVIEHTRLLIYRMTRKNYITPDINQATEETGDSRVDVLVNTIINYIRSHYDLVIPSFEMTYLRNEMIGKLSYVDSQEESRYKQMIEAALQKLDGNYDTHFADDEELKASLLIHLATLFKRLSINRQLRNPLIDDIYTRYANVINTTLDFMQDMLPGQKLNISKDELGYIAIYFAASLEKQKVQEMEAYRHVVVLTDNGRGLAYLLETGLKRLFPNAEIETLAINEANMINQSVDLVVSTVATEQLPLVVPTIEINQVLSAQTMDRVENAVHLLRETPTHFINSKDQIMALFDAEHFQTISTGDYKNILRQRGTLLESDHSARHGFTESVIEREEKIDTVYEHGIAGPHPMSSFANIERIDVTVLRHPIMLGHKPVQVIFLINIRQGHLVLHQEISKMMIALMNDPTLLTDLHQIRNYQDFISIITIALNRR